ncbi:microtubule-associated protein futsch-like [Carassius auratus]|uniref:Microtubule-associated protein futsch-like n=1 Tax=Carassius auratus TaxID=7957 RepID=A0A6P6LJ88_CARAU|nr:microtubule-associated protein futsch-like [Carassius auratus]
MVAGMVMPLDNLKAIYEHLFRDGVMVAKKDKRPQTKHPEIPSVDNLQVIRAMGSLKSRGYVKETFAWRHYYWYLTNEGVVYLRDYLHLPPEIVPTPLQRVRRPAATLAITRRAEHVQAIQGPTSYVPKPGKMGSEKQEALLDRQEYRRKIESVDESEMIEYRERTPRFRGRPMASSQIKPKGSWESKEQPLLSDTQDYTKEIKPSVKRKVAVHPVCHTPPIETYHAKPVEQEKMVELKECTKTAFIQKTVNVSPDVAAIFPKVGETAAESTSTVTGERKMAKDAHHPTTSKPKVEKKKKTFVTKNVQDMPAVSSGERTIAVESSLYSVHAKSVKEKPKEEVVFQQTSSTVTAKDAARSTPSKPKVEETQKTTVVRNVQDVSSTSGATSDESSVPSVPAEAAKQKSEEEVFIKVSKKTKSTAEDDSKMAEDALYPIPSELKVEKTHQSLKTKKVSAVSSAVELSVSSEEVCVNVSKETTPKIDCKIDKDATRPVESKPKVEKTHQATAAENIQDVPIASSAVETTAVKSSVSTEAVKEKPKEEVYVKVSQAAFTGDSKRDKNAPHLTASKTKVEKTQKTTKSKNVQDISNVSPKAVESSVFPVSAEAVKEKSTEEVFMKVSQETTFTVTGDIKMAKDASYPTPKVEKTQKTRNVQDEPAVLSAVETTAVKSSISTDADTEKPKEEMHVSVSQEIASKGDSKKDKNAPCSAPLKPKVEKKQKTTKTKNVHEKPIKNEKADVTNAIHADEMKPSTSISARVSVKSVESAIPLLPEKDKDLAIHIAEKKSKMNLPLHPSELPVEETAVPPTASSTVQMIDKQQRALDSQKTKEIQEASRDGNTSLLKVHEKEEIPCAISTAEVKAEVKVHKPDLSHESQPPSTADSSKISQVVVQMPKKLDSNTDSDSVKQKPSPAKLTEEPVVTGEVTAATDGDTEDAPKPSKQKKKKQKSANKTSAVKPVPPPIAETKVIEVKTENDCQVDLLKFEGPEKVATNDSAKTSPEGTHTVESVQPTAVQNEDPTHKGEVEPAQPLPEKREVLKGKTSSSQGQWEAPAASASAAAASTQLTPSPSRGSLPALHNTRLLLTHSRAQRNIAGSRIARPLHSLSSLDLFLLMRIPVMRKSSP